MTEAVKPQLVQELDDSLKDLMKVNLNQLSRTFVRHGKDFKAVDNLSMEMLQGQIFVLLGRNGA